MRREYPIATKAYISLYDTYIEIEAELSLVFALVVPGLAYIRLPFVPQC